MTVQSEDSVSERDRSALSPNEDIDLYDFCFGFLTTKDIETLLQEEGDFLIRKCEIGGVKAFQILLQTLVATGQLALALAVKCQGQIKQFVVNEKDGNYYFEKHQEKTIRELLDWHIKTKSMVSEASHAVLKRGVPQPSWYIRGKDVKLIKKLGEGAFGEVYLGEYTMANGKIRNAAVKTLRVTTAKKARQNFLREARVMRKLEHKNIVQLYGIVTESDPLMILMELCTGGSILSYLRKNRGHIEEKTKIGFTAETASGLAHLEKLHFIHRDIAARNCLLDKDNHVKISDFGMTNEGLRIQDTNLAKVPIKWLAPETMQERIYSSKSDVWSFGITVWEIFSEGYEPYPSLSNIQTRAKIIIQNYRMEMPKGTPPLIASLVARCWETNPDDRPTFKQICEKLKEIC